MAQTKKTKSRGTGSKQTASGTAKKQSAKKGTQVENDIPRESRAGGIAPYIIVFSALLITVCLIIGEGTVGGGIKGALAGLFSGAAYALPVLMIIRAVTWKKDLEEGAFAPRTICLLIVFILISMVIYIIGVNEYLEFSPAMHYQNGKEFIGGGVVGGILGELMMKGFGRICSLIIISFAAVLLFLYIAGLTPRGVFIYIAYKIKVGLDKRRENKQQRLNPERREQKKIREEEYLNYLRTKKEYEEEHEMERDREQEHKQVVIPLDDEPSMPSQTKSKDKKAEPEPTVYKVKKGHGKDKTAPTELIPNVIEEADVSGSGYEETVISEAAPAPAVEAPALSEPKPAEDDFGGAVDERIFDEVMRRTRERIEKSKKSEETDITGSSSKKTEKIKMGERNLEKVEAVLVDTETGEVFADTDLSDDSDVPWSPDGADTDNVIFGTSRDSADDTDGNMADAWGNEDEAETEGGAADTADTDSVSLAVSVSAGNDNGEYNVSDIFVNPEDAELLDKLSEAYRSGSSLDVKRGAIGTAEKAESPKIKTAVPDYKFPPVELLTADAGGSDEDIKTELQENAVKLVETLKCFNVHTKIEDISRGPTITRYELYPEPGTRVRSITNLVDDIALNLATKGVRIEAPIPGKSAVGIEVPNKNQSTVHLRTLICDDRFVNAKSKLTVCLGEDVAGEPVYFDIAKMPHLLIAGTTGSGKSVCINSVITSLLYKASPEDVKMILIDPKKVELNIYNGIPHLLSPVISDTKKAAGSLSWAVSEMERRFGLIESVGVRDISQYNKVTKDDPDYEFMNRIVIIIDELADFMMTAPDEVEDSICRIAQKARAAGMHLIIGTQRPSVNVITGLIKANVPSRISFAVSSQVDSRVIIDKAGAETLIGRGDMLFSPVGSMTPVRVQGAFVSEEDVEEIVTYIKNMNSIGDNVYSEEVLKQIEEEAARCGIGKKGASAQSGSQSSEDDDGEEDPMLKAAIELAVDSGKISTSLIQRKLSLGYGRAAKLIDAMENMGYVSAPEGRNPRKVLITKQQYMEMVLRDDVPFE